MYRGLYISAHVLSGLLAAAVVLGVGELVAVPFGPNSSPFFAVGSAVVDNTPEAVREWAIDTFGTSDKTALFVGMAVVIASIAAAAGVLRRPWGAVLFGVLGAVGVLAAVTRSTATPLSALPTIIGVAAGIVVLNALLRTEEPVADGMSRRSFLGLAVTAGVVAVAAGTAGRLLGQARDVTANRLGFRLPTPTPQPPIPAGADLRIDGLASYITPNDEFYRIDTALVVPQVASEDWSLRIHGMVDRELEITFADLATRQAVERTVTLTCVSNIVGGDLVGNATWIGYPLKDLLEEAGIQDGADMVLSSSHDAFTAGTPLEVLLDGRDALLAVGMNGQPLPVEHGYPARLVVPGLYGYVSATKWVTDLEITRFDKASAYWTDRGWGERGPIKTASRIDTPKPGAAVDAGTVVVAGVAWHQHTGISGVDVQIDDGNWVAATLSEEYSTDTWRQWTYEWAATPGQHTIRARATDGNGDIQTSMTADTVPDGATGYPKAFVTVR
ncbi:molybdopterin-dependent oxidoreductase [Rhodococcus sp. BP-252]|uniref:molybdopterin-dependent oxidoreductase n=1 Tax=unclassified Rhodococcus (in: high G+C Gram-positive bacteria) TaxID=192944 RepID=UPI001C9B0333|nr:molybdopterin-dependent oxidoreductase [Rhodococcus sp. BP-320]MBY6417950.1 molybdopterin-dependent oxidoreductase [Rhodococcus sp. BP-321]MBY6422149.1 molybdopterin-dependent oxidoreductase [Rhodococcus sp. BP-324]MBY6427748.1 molybdopterin-dependent oxidoreductase [Rhodococcus sp. BP-323]MBY6433033.1 molybdopterin-dependent oxidoreductase [Rhodococcus sp. BP-322]MBY6441844.1 molybdopterin-dependent oxidoreductase [Rhodococcus sp. BP-319]MBY6445409.1 molybdopterin-dependent oxidoreductase